VRRRVLRDAATGAGSPPGDLTYRHLCEVDRLLTDWHGQTGVDLPGLVRATRVAGAASGPALHLTQAPPPAVGPRDDPRSGAN
jgi:hypothetical protein